MKTTTGGSKSKASVTKMRKAPVGKAVMKKAGPKKAAVGYLTKSSGTTRREVKGVMKELRRGAISKGGAIKALKGGPKAGVPTGNKKRVARAIKKAR